MATKTVTARIPEKNVKALDALAKFQQRDRSYIINQAVNQLILEDQLFREAVEEGLRQMEAGQGIPHEEVVAEFEAMWRKPKTKVAGKLKKRAA